MPGRFDIQPTGLFNLAPIRVPQIQLGESQGGRGGGYGRTSYLDGLRLQQQQRQFEQNLAFRREDRAAGFAHDKEMLAAQMAKEQEGIYSRLEASVYEKSMDNLAQYIQTVQGSEEANFYLPSNFKKSQELLNNWFSNYEEFMNEASSIRASGDSNKAGTLANKYYNFMAKTVGNADFQSFVSTRNAYVGTLKNVYALGNSGKYMVDWDAVNNFRNNVEANFNDDPKALPINNSQLSINNFLVPMGDVEELYNLAEGMYTPKTKSKIQPDSAFGIPGIGSMQSEYLEYEDPATIKENLYNAIEKDPQLKRAAITAAGSVEAMVNKLENLNYDNLRFNAEDRIEYTKHGRIIPEIPTGTTTGSGTGISASPAFGSLSKTAQGLAMQIELWGYDSNYLGAVNLEAIANEAGGNRWVDPIVETKEGLVIRYGIYDADDAPVGEDGSDPKARRTEIGRIVIPKQFKINTPEEKVKMETNTIYRDRAPGETNYSNFIDWVHMRNEESKTGFDIVNANDNGDSSIGQLQMRGSTLDGFLKELETITSGWDVKTGNALKGNVNLLKTQRDEINEQVTQLKEMCSGNAFCLRSITHMTPAQARANPEYADLSQGQKDLIGKIWEKEAQITNTWNKLEGTFGSDRFKILEQNYLYNTSYKLTLDHLEKKLGRNVGAGLTNYVVNMAHTFGSGKANKLIDNALKDWDPKEDRRIDTDIMEAIHDARLVAAPGSVDRARADYLKFSKDTQTENDTRQVMNSRAWGENFVANYGLTGDNFETTAPYVSGPDNVVVTEPLTPEQEKEKQASEEAARQVNKVLQEAGNQNTISPERLNIVKFDPNNPGDNSDRPSNKALLDELARSSNRSGMATSAGQANAPSRSFSEIQLTPLQNYTVELEGGVKKSLPDLINEHVETSRRINTLKTGIQQGNAELTKIIDQHNKNVELTGRGNLVLDANGSIPDPNSEQFVEFFNSLRPPMFSTGVFGQIINTRNNARFTYFPHGGQDPYNVYRVVEGQKQKLDEQEEKLRTLHSFTADPILEALRVGTLAQKGVQEGLIQMYLRDNVYPTIAQPGEEFVIGDFTVKASSRYAEKFIITEQGAEKGKYVSEKELVDIIKRKEPDEVARLYSQRALHGLTSQKLKLGDLD